MAPLGFHLVFRLRDDRVFAPSPATRRRLARVMARLSEVYPILAWRVVDTHIHVLGLFAAADVKQLTRRLRLALVHLHPGIPVLLSREVPVLNQWHLGEAFAYILRQDEHHGVQNDPLQEGSCVQDLLGMRLLGLGLIGLVREHLPRVRREDLVPRLGVAELSEGAAIEHLVDATCAAFVLPELAGQMAEVVAARAAAVHAARELGALKVADALGVTRRAVDRILADRSPPPRAVRAVRLQVGLRLAQPTD